MKRIKYLDLVRGLAIFFMVMQHAMLVLEVEAGEGEHLLSVVFVLLGMWPAAPIFMVVMGVFMAKSNMTSLEFLKRGAKLFILGYLLNLVRFTIPLLIAEEYEEAYKMFFEIDILQLAGLSFILLAYIKDFAKNRFLYPVLMVIIMIVTPYIWGDYHYFTDPFIGNSDIVSFPVFPFIVYPMLGMYLSKYLLHMKNTYARNLCIASILMAILGFLLLGENTSYDYPKYTIDMNLLMMAFVIMWCVIAYKISDKLGELPILTIWSRNITQIYIIQWIIYGYSILFLGANECSPLLSTFIGLIVMVITHLLITKTKITKFIPKV